MVPDEKPEPEIVTAAEVIVVLTAAPVTGVNENCAGSLTEVREKAYSTLLKNLVPPSPCASIYNLAVVLVPLLFLKLTDN